MNMKPTLLTLLAALGMAVIATAFADHVARAARSLVAQRTRRARPFSVTIRSLTSRTNKPVKGDAKIQIELTRARTYWFASAEHKALFDANPAKYAPAYGGYCGYAASIDRLSPISPDWFQIIDGRLVSSSTTRRPTISSTRSWPSNVVKADKNWPGLVARNGTGGKTLVLTDKKGVALEGYDPVSLLHRRQASAKGDANIEATYNGALYHFVSQATSRDVREGPVEIRAGLRRLLRLRGKHRQGASG